ncbi:unnamed protein product [Ambrosiozyma monospora]|uniref:Unnamed protein product n=1 Tax=Ambrosiozyma monospora TaxID=43982 RepID=A0ACB5SXW1_AMBMO|nr:unnamed protein product [Ambrosiozyma monospora]
MERAEKEAKYKAEEEAKLKEEKEEAEAKAKEEEEKANKSKEESEKDNSAKLMKRWEEPDEVKYEGTEKYIYKTHFREQLTKDKLVRPMFHHIHTPKLHPFKIVKSHVTQDNDGHKIRILGDFYKTQNLNYPRPGTDKDSGIKGEVDLEMEIFKLFDKNLCGSDKLKFDAFANEDFTVLCGHEGQEEESWIKQHLRFLEESY